MGMEKRYRYLEHMTDLVIEAYGNNIAEGFENSAIATINAMFDISKVESKNKIRIIAKGYDLKSLLYDWIEKILLAIYVDKIVINNFEYIILSHNIKEDQVIKNKIISSSQDKSKKISRVVENEIFNLISNESNETLMIEAVGIGEPPNILKHDYKVEIKSVTYHEMDIRFDNNIGYIFKFLLDL